MISTFNNLIKEEGIGAVTKGLSARVLSMVPSSLVIVIGYETVKKLSLKTEQEEKVEEEGYLEAAY